MFDLENSDYVWLNLCHDNLQHGLGSLENYYYFLSLLTE